MLIFELLACNHQQSHLHFSKWSLM